MSAPRYRAKRARHTHHGALDAFAAVPRMAYLPPGPVRAAVAERLVVARLPAGRCLAHTYQGRGGTTEKPEQVAALRLVEAVRRYGPFHGTPFEPFAIPTITGEIRRHLCDHTGDLHVSRRVQELRTTIRAGVQVRERRQILAARPVERRVPTTA